MPIDIHNDPEAKDAYRAVPGYLRGRLRYGPSRPKRSWKTAEGWETITESLYGATTYLDPNTGQPTTLKWEYRSVYFDHLKRVCFEAKRRGATARGVWLLMKNPHNRLGKHVHAAMTLDDFERLIWDDIEVDRQVLRLADARRATIAYFEQSGAREPFDRNGVAMEPGQVNGNELWKASTLPNRGEFDRMIRDPLVELGLMEQEPKPYRTAPLRYRLTVPPTEALERLDAYAWQKVQERDHKRAQARAAKRDAHAARKADPARGKSVYTSGSDDGETPLLNIPLGTEDDGSGPPLTLDQMRVMALDSTPAAPQAQTGPVSFADVLAVDDDDANSEQPDAA